MIPPISCLLGPLDGRLPLALWSCAFGEQTYLVTYLRLLRTLVKVTKVVRANTRIVINQKHPLLPAGNDSIFNNASSSRAFSVIKSYLC